MSNTPATVVKPARTWLGPIAAALLIGLVTSPLLVGWEPVGGDPDRMYRPIKTELARALSAGTLPYWSDRFGTGLPLIAESHVAAFYPPNWPLYRIFDVAFAYRLSMWMHMVCCAGAAAFYAGRCGCETWGSALSGLAFTLCGSQAIHASHEIHYCTAAYIPICLGFSELYAETGRVRWLAWLAIASGAQWTIGHFQFQCWTACLVLFIGTWRIVADDRPRIRLLGLAAGVGWGVLIATVQLWPSWQLSNFVGQLDRSVAARSYYAFPPAHWAELGMPRLFRSIPGGPMAAYWSARQTTGYEAALFVGTVPLILAFIGAIRPQKALRPWLVIIAGTLALATMPQWWPAGYEVFLKLPGPGYFRAPARYALFASLGMALLAGRGLDRSLSSRVFRKGLVAAIVFGIIAFAWAGWWTSRPALSAAFAVEPLVLRFGVPLTAWLAALVTIVAWRKGHWPAWPLLFLVAIELGALYYTTAIRWGWHVELSEASPVLKRLAEENPLRLVGGDLENYPLYAGAATAAPYLGFKTPPPGGLLAMAGDRAAATHSTALRWLQRLGVTHQVWSGELSVERSLDQIPVFDEVLDQIVERPPGAKPWTIVRLQTPFDRARVATRVQMFPDYPALVQHLALVDEADVAHYVLQNVPHGAPVPRASSAVVTAWNDSSGVVQHDGTCILIIARTFYPGWSARIDGVVQAVHPIDGGLQGVVIEGAGTSRVELFFEPIGGREAATISLVALGAAISVVVAGVRQKWSRIHRLVAGDAPRPLHG